MRTPLRPGTRWTDISTTGWESTREIVAIEDVCTPRGKFRGAIKVVTHRVRVAAPEQGDAWVITRWIAKGYGDVLGNGRSAMIAWSVDGGSGNQRRWGA